MNNMTNEACIVWHEDITEIDYVRMVMTTGPRRAGRPKLMADGRLIGWAELALRFVPDIPGVFDRRAFWLKPYDRGERDDRGDYQFGCPAEAVDPRTVFAGDEGYLTLRALYGGPERRVAAERMAAMEELLGE